MIDSDFEIDQDDFDGLVEMATHFALIISDGRVEFMQRFLREHGQDMSSAARKRLAAHIIEHGPFHERDQALWAAVLRELQPRREPA